MLKIFEKDYFYGQLKDGSGRIRVFRSMGEICGIYDDNTKNVVSGQWAA